MTRLRLDRLCRAVVLERDRHRCVRCGRDRHQTQLHWAHVHTRAVLSLRWRPENSMCLCARCHLLWHGQIVAPAEGDPRGWWAEKYPERERRLRLHLGTRGHRVDVALTEAALRVEWRRLTGQEWAGA